MKDEIITQQIQVKKKKFARYLITSQISGNTGLSFLNLQSWKVFDRFYYVWLIMQSFLGLFSLYQIINLEIEDYILI